jgi:acetyl esterase/lipase
MCMGLISHILHPLAGLKPLKLEEPLAGLLLISAWVSFQSDSQAYLRNRSKDIHTGGAMHEWADDFALESERNKWSEPIQADALWWKAFPVNKTMNIWGDYELFQDDIAKFGQVLEAAGAGIRNVECPLQVHIDCILDAQTGLEVGPMSTETWKWLETIF